jgi:chromate transporter
VLVVLLGWAYEHFGGLPWMQAVFYGVGACVIGIIALGAYQLTRKTVRRDWLLWPVFLASAVCTVMTETEYVALFLASGALVWFIRARSNSSAPPLAAWLLPLGASSRFDHPFDTQLLVQMALFFAKAGTFVFGSGLAIVPFLYSGVVNEYHWLDESQFLDAVAVAMITPGPVVIAVGFIGYLKAGLTGAAIASVAVFVPCYLFTIVPAPYFRKYGSRPGLVAFVDGVTAAAIGAIAGAVVVLARRTLFEDGHAHAPQIAIALVTLAVLALSKRRVPEPLVVLAAALAGLAIYPYLGP